MKNFTIILFLLTNTLLVGQTQWFPAKYDESLKQVLPDSSGAFPVSFISQEQGQIYMYGHHTHYRTKMTLKQNCYFSDNLIMPAPGDSIRQIYIFSSYYFYINKSTAKLIVKNKFKTDTIIFIKSRQKFTDINAKWG